MTSGKKIIAANRQVSSVQGLFERARKRVSAAQQVDAVLNDLDPEDRETVLFDSLVRWYRPPAVDVQHVEPVKKMAGPRVKIVVQKKGRPAKPDGGYSRGMLRLLYEHPKMPIAEMALALYGSSEEVERRRVQNMAFEHKRAGHAKKVGPAEWVVTEEGCQYLGVPPALSAKT